MISINTNLSSFIAQNSLNTSTNKLNETIERMSSGYKINHAKDNAANYSISTNMTTKIGAYKVAEDNASMGLDMVTTASETLSEMQNHATRLRALVTQARNGTYGQQSLKAIQEEAVSITSELVRIYNTAQYNGMNLFSNKNYEIAPHLPQAEKNSFIDETAMTTNKRTKQDGFIENPVTYTDEELESMLSRGELKVLDDSVTSFSSGQKYLISDKTELERLATLVNSGKDSSGAIFILGEDIDLKNEEWTPIGTDSKLFKGVFDGNGHTIKNLKIANSTSSYQGLFGFIYGAEIKNIGLKGDTVKGFSYVGFLVGYNAASKISNSYATGDVIGYGNNIGGLVGYNYSNSTIISSYATGIVNGEGRYTGGLVGNNDDSTITNSYSTGDVFGQGNQVGGLVGNNYTNSTITNSYSTGDVFGQGNYVGGLVGSMGSNSTITNSYATGDVIGQSGYVGGLSGDNVTNSTITNSYATGDVIGQGNNVGGLLGYNSNSTIINSYSTGKITGQTYVGGLVGLISATNSNSKISDCAFYGEVNSENLKSGILIGGIRNTSDNVNYKNVVISNCEVMPSDKNIIGGALRANWSINPDYDMTDWLDEIKDVKILDTSTTLQVGISNTTSSSLRFDMNFEFDISKLESEITSDTMLETIDDLINLLSEKETKLGAVSNRLDSALDEITTQYENLVSSRSTLRDADMAELSSTYIQQQILQQASSTLMASSRNLRYENVLGLLNAL